MSLRVYVGGSGFSIVFGLRFIAFRMLELRGSGLSRRVTFLDKPSIQQTPVKEPMQESYSSP